MAALLAAWAYTSTFEHATSALRNWRQRSRKPQQSQKAPETKAKLEEKQLQLSPIVEKLRENQALKASLPSLNSPSTFVEFSKTQRRIQALERSLAACSAEDLQLAEDALEGVSSKTCGSDEVAKESVSSSVLRPWSREWILEKLLQAIGYILISNTLAFVFAKSSQPLAIVVNRLILWPFDALFGKAIVENADTAADEDMEISPCIVLFLFQFAFSRARKEVDYFKKIWR
eukprot:TRINITY_DN10143_c1_g1_i1.p1 TRINITY_DN10143_c1_g1~~TRINITY_DN10143_c1_g1_i1.p1  ORF type:complete len:271 (-),score=38.89 TRINITY_DN10143_c1_g1_i1:88-780(-)